MFDDEADKLIAEILANVDGEIFDPWEHLHPTDDPREDESWEEQLVAKLNIGDQSINGRISNCHTTYIKCVWGQRRKRAHCRHIPCIVSTKRARSGWIRADQCCIPRVIYTQWAWG